METGTPRETAIVPKPRGRRFRPSVAKSVIATLLAGRLLSAARRRRGKSALLLLGGGLAIQAYLALSSFKKRNET